jgi:hypothetical protein
MLEYARIFAYRTDMNLIGRDGRTDGRDGRTDAQTTLLGCAQGFIIYELTALTCFNNVGYYVTHGALDYARSPLL